MNKETIIILHPKEWATSEYGRKSQYNYVHVSIGGKVPKKRHGTPTYDGYADVATPEGFVALKEAFKAFRPKAFFYWMHADFTVPMLHEIRRISPNTKFIHWYSNHRSGLPLAVQKRLDFIDMLVCNTSEPLYHRIFKEAGIEHVRTFWDGFAPNWNPNPDMFTQSEVELSMEEPIYDVSFGGNSYLRKAQVDQRLRFPAGQDRFDFVCQVGKRFNLALHSDSKAVWGEAGLEVLKPVFHPLYTNALRKAKITINWNHFPKFRHAYTRRTIRCLFAKRCHITKYIPGMEDHFENHKHLVWFDTIDEGLELIDHYLKNDEEREKIAQQGWELGMREHTFEVRMKQFEKLLEVWG